MDESEAKNVKTMMTALFVAAILVNGNCRTDDEGRKRILETAKKLADGVVER